MTPYHNDILRHLLAALYIATPDRKTQGEIAKMLMDVELDFRTVELHVRHNWADHDCDEYELLRVVIKYLGGVL